MTDTPSNRDDIIDSRDVTARIEELESDRTALVDAITEASAEMPDEDPDGKPPVDATTAEALRDWEEENGDELKSLKALADEGEGCSDWGYGCTLVRDSYFEKYAQEFADDIGAIDRNAKWPLDCIDWEKAARELQMDYTSVDFDGVTYWGLSG